MKTATMALLALLLTGCRQYGRQSFNAYFWGKIPAADKCHLYIDGVEKGLAPYLANDLADDPDSLRLRGLHLLLKCGSYKILLKDNNNHIVSKGTVRINAYNGFRGVSYSGDGKCGLKVTDIAE